MTEILRANDNVVLPAGSDSEQRKAGGNAAIPPKPEGSGEKAGGNAAIPPRPPGGHEVEGHVLAPAVPADDLAKLAGPLCRDGFVHAYAPDMRAILHTRGLTDWEGFAASWNDLGVDSYMADGGRYRRRRHAAMSASDAAIRRKPRQPHYQSRDYNPLNGGIARWFDPVTDATASHPALHAILRFCLDIFTGCTPAATRPAAWHVELHQFRVESRAGETGKPTPEGLHRDGVDWVLVLLVARENVTSGETSIHDLQQRHLGSFTLSEPMEAALVDDDRVYHGVTPVTPIDASKPAYRDVLVATFRRE
jgi:hypothetical protein